MSARYYYVDLPFLALWGDRVFDRISPIDDYFDDAAKGTLPSVVMVDPGFQGPDRSDNHPHGDIRMAQRYLNSVFGVRALSAMESLAVRPHLRRVGWLLRPRGAAGGRRRSRERHR